MRNVAFSLKRRWQAAGQTDVVNALGAQFLRQLRVPAAYAEWSRQNGFAQVNSIVFKKLLGERGEVARGRPMPNENPTTILLHYRIL